MKYFSVMFDRGTPESNMSDYLNKHEVPRENIVAISHAVDGSSHRRFGSFSSNQILLTFMIPKEDDEWDYRL